MTIKVMPMPKILEPFIVIGRGINCYDLVNSIFFFLRIKTRKYFQLAETDCVVLPRLNWCVVFGRGKTSVHTTYL